MKGTISSLLILLATLACLYCTKATVTVSPERQQPTPCNSCCQSPPGTQGNPGIPGSNGLPGTNGMPGSMGLKGERGESVKGDAGQDGQRGQKGDVGDMGLKGERGTGGLRGLPGKVGPAGIAGPVGSRGPVGIFGRIGPPGPQGGTGLVGRTGLPGVKGQKGEMGQSRLSAFSAVRDTSFRPSSADLALPFDSGNVYTNVGDDFDVASGRFTCEIPGIYLFTYNIMTYGDDVYVQLKKNEEPINSIYKRDVNDYFMVSNSAVLQLAAGDQVWLRCAYSGNQIYSNSSLYTTFSGVILHET